MNFALPKLVKKAAKAASATADPNALLISLGTLGKTSEIATGDATFCDNCHAVFTKISKLQENEEDPEEQLWSCEFCGFKNTVSIQPEEIPKDNTVDFILETADQNTQDESMVLFCLDISGSMCESQPINTPIHIKSKKSIAPDIPAELLAELGVDDISQLMQNQGNFLTRLEGAQAAVESQLDTMKEQYPNRKVGLVTFNNEVVLYLDGENLPVTVTGDKLNDFNTLLDIGKQTQVSKPISESYSKLSDKLWSISESGATALGPALTVSIGIAAKKPGSSVIIVTDGRANIGVGSFETEKGNLDHIIKFYEDVGKFAKEHGVIVSVISIKGTDCRMEYLGSVAAATGGEVNIVDPLNLSQNFNSILKNPVVATNVRLELIFSKYLTLKNDYIFDKAESSEKKEEEVECRYIKNIGNATKDTEVGIIFAINDQIPPEVSSIPFQASIYYTALNKNKYLRVITHEKVITSSEAMDELNKIDVAVYSAVTGQVSASLAQQGRYEEALSNASNNHTFLQNVVQSEEQKVLLDQYSEQLEHTNNILQNQMCLDSRMGVRTNHYQNRIDDTAVELYQLKQAKSAACSVM